MNTLAAAIYPMLFADQQAIRNVMRGLHHKQNQFDGSGLATALMIFCLFFVCVWGFARVFLKPETRTEKGPRALLRELCRTHGLTWRDWWLLRRLAARHRLSEPAALFLDPRPFEAALAENNWGQSASRLRALRRTIFIGLPLPPIELPGQ